MIYVVASQQDLHLAQFFKVLELMGYRGRRRRPLVCNTSTSV